MEEGGTSDPEGTVSVGAVRKEEVEAQEVIITQEAGSGPIDEGKVNETLADDIKMETNGSTSLSKETELALGGMGETNGDSHTPSVEVEMVVEYSAPLIEDSAPLIEDSAPLIEDSAPLIEDNSKETKSHTENKLALGGMGGANGDSHTPSVEVEVFVEDSALLIEDIDITNGLSLGKGGDMNSKEAEPHTENKLALGGMGGANRDSHSPSVEVDGTVEDRTLLIEVVHPARSGGDEDEVTAFRLSKSSVTAIPVGSEKIPITAAQNYKPGDSVHAYLPGLPVVADVGSNLTSNRSRGPQFVISLEHGPFTWKVYKFYSDFLTLRRVLHPLRLRVRLGRRGRGRKRGYLPHLLTVTDINPLQISRTQNQLPKCRKFLNAVLNDREWRSHRSTLKFFEISRLSFIEDLGAKQKEGVITKRSGGRRRVTNCLGVACCVCHCSVWRQRWLVLKDSFLAYIRSDRRTIAGVLLFDEGMTIKTGSIQTGLLFGLEITTKTRTLLVRCPSSKSLKEWKEALLRLMASSGKEWVTEKRFLSFAPPREGSTVQWFVDGEGFMSQVANALLAAREEIYITDWMISPQIYLKRSKDKSSVHNLNFRLDKILMRKAKEGVKVYLQIYKEVTVAISLGSEYAKEELKHPNIMFFRHPEHIHTGVYKWAHHEKIVVIDQTLAFVGGIDLAFGRYDDHCHDLADGGYTVNLQIDKTTQPIERTSFKWTGKDYHNPFFRDISRHHEPLEDDLDRAVEPRMPWHDIASCVFGAAARDVARHFIQRYNFTRHEQSLLLENFLLPRSKFNGSDREMLDFSYLQEVIVQQQTTNANVQILRSVDQWSAGTTTEHSILNAYLATIEKAQHFIYIENQFFISSLREVRNSIAEALRVRIGRAHQNKKTFRVIIVMPLLPSFNGDLADSSGTIPKAIIHWNYKTISRGEESLYHRLTHIDGISPEEISNYLSVNGLRTYGQIHDKLVSEIVYVHSKCMIVDDRITIIGSANINDRSMLGERDSEMAVIVEDREMIEGVMDGEVYSVGKFSHSLRCNLFREHLGLLEDQDGYRSQSRESGVQQELIDVRDPASEKFYRSWCSVAERNVEIFEKVFGGKHVPTDSVLNYVQLRSFKETPGLAETDPAEAQRLLSCVRGYLVPVPLNFLSEEDLLPAFGAKEHIAPEIFT